MSTFLREKIKNFLKNCFSASAMIFHGGRSGGNGLLATGRWGVRRGGFGNDGSATAEDNGQPPPRRTVRCNWAETNDLPRAGGTERSNGNGWLTAALARRVWKWQGVARQEIMGGFPRDRAARNGWAETNGLPRRWNGGRDFMRFSAPQRFCAALIDVFNIYVAFYFCR